MKRTAALCLAALLACSLAIPAMAADILYPVEVTEYMEGDSSRLKKIYVLTPADDPSLIPTEDFDREGQTYTLLDITRQDQVETDTRDYTETVTLESKTKDMDAILPQLTATLEVDTEEGYTGVLTLDTASIQVEAAGYSTSTRALTAARTYPNLSDADVSLIPKSIEDGGRTLELANIQWQEAGEFYTANATYTGTASSKYATGYTVTAEYSGEVSRTTNDTVTYAAVFSANPTQMQTAAKSGMNWRWLLVLPAGAAAAGLFFGGKFLLKKYKSKKNWEEYTK
ncbi:MULTISPECIES: hypothetical protein [Dysosmobacter]|uniref:hypothetical protein n=1 Tax=Dysosmobacter TaxID=2591381 RepID=UPI002848FB54|nr:hypothetical protein [Dysosmobacter sp.]MDR4034744.1 hypothetical protein [Dysosmobacter sp.]